jgi:hypothetical protein
MKQRGAGAKHAAADGFHVEVAEVECKGQIDDIAAQCKAI